MCATIANDILYRPCFNNYVALCSINIAVCQEKKLLAIREKERGKEGGSRMVRLADIGNTN